MQGGSCNLERVIHAQTMQINAFRISPQGQGQYKRSIQEHNMKICAVNVRQRLTERIKSWKEPQACCPPPHRTWHRLRDSNAESRCRRQRLVRICIW